MPRSSSSRSRRRLLPKTIWSLLLVVWLGAIGSGVWELVLKGIARTISGRAGSASKSILIVVLDHALAGAGVWDGTSFLSRVLTPFFGLVMVAAPLSLVYFYRQLLAAAHSNGPRELRGADLNPEVKVRIPMALISWPRSVSTALVVLALVNAAYYADIALHTWAGRRTANYEAQALDLLGPFASQFETAYIKASYRKVNDLDSLGEFLGACKIVADKNHVILPPFP